MPGKGLSCSAKLCIQARRQYQCCAKVLHSGNMPGLTVVYLWAWLLSLCLIWSHGSWWINHLLRPEDGHLLVHRGQTRVVKSRDYCFSATVLASSQAKPTIRDRSSQMRTYLKSELYGFRNLLTIFLWAMEVCNPSGVAKAVHPFSMPCLWSVIKYFSATNRELTFQFNK